MVKLYGKYGAHEKAYNIVKVKIFRSSFKGERKGLILRSLGCLGQ